MRSKKYYSLQKWSKVTPEIHFASFTSKVKSKFLRFPIGDYVEKIFTERPWFYFCNFKTQCFKDCPLYSLLLSFNCNIMKNNHLYVFEPLMRHDKFFMTHSLQKLSVCSQKWTFDYEWLRDKTIGQLLLIYKFCSAKYCF